MARTLKEEKAEEVPIRRPLPRIKRELHSPVDTFGRAAAHMRFPSESVYRSSAQADFAYRVLRNLSEVMPEGSTPLPTRFLRMLS